MYLAGVSAGTVRRSGAVQLARRDLLTDGVGPQPDPVLAGRLLRLRDRGIRLCCAQIPGGREERRFWPAGAAGVL